MHLRGNKEGDTNKNVPTIQARGDPDAFWEEGKQYLGDHESHPWHGIGKHKISQARVLEEGGETSMILFEVAQISTFRVSERGYLLGPKEQESPRVTMAPAWHGCARRVSRVKHVVCSGNAASCCPPAQGRGVRLLSACVTQSVAVLLAAQGPCGIQSSRAYTTSFRVNRKHPF